MFRVFFLLNFFILGSDVTNVPQFIADVTDEETLKVMANSALAIINCCGPYRFYGEPVVKACLAAGTHHLDISGEPQVFVIFLFFLQIFFMLC